MSELWPLDVKMKLDQGPVEPLRPFRCLLLMPFESRFNAVADLIKATVSEVVEGFKGFGFEPLPQIQRLDWVTSSGVIQREIWREIYDADLVFCDVTGYNANVLFESGVAAAWKRIEQVVFIRDHFYKGQSPFDMAPLRYTEYTLTSDGIAEFKGKLQQLLTAAVIAFPDSQGVVPPLSLPLHVDFGSGYDDLRIYTPPFAHRRVVINSLEFGSLFSFSHSWASIGKEILSNFSIHFKARFSNPLPNDGYIGVGFRSQHFFANFGHILYLRWNGSIVLTEPNEVPPKFYEDRTLREPTPLDLSADHEFSVSFDQTRLRIAVNDFNAEFDVARMPKVFGPGLVRFQSFRSWMALIEVDVRSL
jgi:hypothetical protein